MKAPKNKKEFTINIGLRILCSLIKKHILRKVGPNKPLPPPDR